jgi:hypothetical protein
VLDHNTGVFGLCGVSTWTAARQLYYSMTPETALGPYDLVWNWVHRCRRRDRVMQRPPPVTGILGPIAFFSSASSVDQ